MQARSKLKPGQKGTKKLVELYGSRLVCVRSRDDEPLQKRFKTVELIIEESPHAPLPKIKPDAIVGLRIALNESVLEKRAKQVGDVWNRNRQLWDIRYDRVVELNLEERIESDGRSTNRSRYLLIVITIY